MAKKSEKELLKSTLENGTMVIEDPEIKLQQIADDLNKSCAIDASVFRALTTKFICSSELANTNFSISYDGNFYIDGLSVINYLNSFYEETENEILYKYLAFDDTMKLGIFVRKIRKA